MKLFGRWKGRTLSGFEKKKIKKNILPYSVLLAALFAMTFFGVCIPQSGPTGPRGPAAYIDNQVISYRQFRRSYEAVENRMRQSKGADFDPAKENISAATMEGLVYQYVAYILAKELGIVASSAQVYDYISKFEYFKNTANEFDREKFRNFLDFQGYTESSFFDEVRRELTFFELEKFVNSFPDLYQKTADYYNKLSEAELKLSYMEIDPNNVKVDLSKKDVDEFLATESNLKLLNDLYQRNVDQYVSDALFKARQIVISFEGARGVHETKRSKSMALDLATKVHADLSENVKTPKKFDELFKKYAKQYIDNPALKQKLGDMGVVNNDDFPEELSKQVFMLKKSQISSIVESKFGFHIVQVYDIEPAKNITFDQIKLDLAKNHLAKSLKNSQAFDFAKKVLSSLTGSSLSDLALDSQSVSESNESSDQMDKDKDKDKEADQKSMSYDFDELTKKYPLSWQDTGYFSFKNHDIPGIGRSVEALLAIFMVLDQQHFVPDDNLTDKDKISAEDNSVIMDTLFPIGSKLYILRVDDLKESKSKEADPMLAFSNEHRLNYFEQLVKYYLDDLEKKHKIKRNQEYLTIDNPNPNM